MNRYKIECELGVGSFGAVYQARQVATGEVVAIKQIKRHFATWEECLGLREVASLSKLKHENIVRLKELVHEAGILWFVFEFVPTNLYKRIQDSTVVFDDDRIRVVMRQLFDGLHYMHKHGFFHRDIKPENLLCDEDKVKIADFGLARETRSRPPYTEYVSTRWYRAPELLLRTSRYNSPIDMWAAGCIMAELYLRKPLFPGTSEVKQMQTILQILGTPSPVAWPEGHKAARNINFRFPKCSGQHLGTLIPTASPDALALIKDLLRYDPHKRPSAAMALGHKFFRAKSKSPLRPRRNSHSGHDLRELKLVDEEVLTPAENSPTVRRTIWPRERSNSVHDDSDKYDRDAGTPNSRTLRSKNSFSLRDGAGAGAGAGGAGAGAGAGTGAGYGGFGSGHSMNPRPLKTETSLDASAMEKMLDELEAEVLNRGRK